MNRPVFFFIWLSKNLFPDTADPALEIPPTSLRIYVPRAWLGWRRFGFRLFVNITDWWRSFPGPCLNGFPAWTILIYFSF